jgi:hypothetical protein
MSDDPREVQSKFDRPAASTSLPKPAQVAPAVVPPVAPAVVPPVAPAVVPPVAPAVVPPVAPAVAPAPFGRSPSGFVSFPPPAPGTDADADYDQDDLPLTFVDRLRRLSPALAILTVGATGSLLFLLRAVTSHTTPVAVLLSAGVVTGLIFVVIAVTSSVGTWRASQDGRVGRALALALVGGFGYLVAFGALAGVLVMILVLNS